jgi:leader peptidase (prepilin peptidase)/N-methyltransferase
MIRILGTIFAGLLGLAFGSFLNVCLSRWPAGESIVQPRSHCRQCNRTLTWWENIPLFSWLALRGRCRTCHTWIGWRYPVVEFAVGALWAISAWRILGLIFLPDAPTFDIALADVFGKMIFYWVLVGLAVLDAENLWLPNWITLPSVALGFLFAVFLGPIDDSWWTWGYTALLSAQRDSLAILIAAALILLIRWAYKLIRHREGIGLGDAKLMALLAAWLGLPGALLAFALGVVLGALAAVVLLLTPSIQKQSEGWAAMKLPLGTFLCIGGIVSSLWGEPILNAYRTWAGF